MILLVKSSFTFILTFISNNSKLIFVHAAFKFQLSNILRSIYEYSIGKRYCYKTSHLILMSTFPFSINKNAVKIQFISISCHTDTPHRAHILYEINAHKKKNNSLLYQHKKNRDVRKKTKYLSESFICVYWYIYTLCIIK